LFSSDSSEDDDDPEDEVVQCYMVLWVNMTNTTQDVC